MGYLPIEPFDGEVEMGFADERGRSWKAMQRVRVVGIRSDGIEGAFVCVWFDEHGWGAIRDFENVRRLDMGVGPRSA